MYTTQEKCTLSNRGYKVQIIFQLPKFVVGNEYDKQQYYIQNSCLKASKFQKYLHSLGLWRFLLTPRKRSWHKSGSDLISRGSNQLSTSPSTKRTSISTEVGRTYLPNAPDLTPNKLFALSIEWWLLPHWLRPSFRQIHWQIVVIAIPTGPK